jgi:tRNA A37 threonylcarbamoyladenosine dehydratase
VISLDEADLERRFGGLRRLYGDAGYQRLRTLRLAVVGVGGVGSWAAEALARSGVATLVLVDLDHVAESNINRQVQALGATIGQAKVQALAERIADIHPGCRVRPIEAFVENGNWPALLGGEPLDGVVDACDAVHGKAALAAWSLQTGCPVVCVGAAGGKRLAHRVEVADLADTTHDPLLSTLRQRLRQRHGAPRRGPIGITAVFSREPVTLPTLESCAVPGSAEAVDGSLNCHGYGSSVAVTASFGLVAAGELIERCVCGAGTAVTERAADVAIMAGSADSELQA